MAIEINGTTGVSGVDGSAATPALQGADTNTGVRFGTDTVAIVTGGVDRVVTDSSGNVGIGTSTPDSKLQVETATAKLRIGYNGTSENYYDANTHYFRSGAGAERARIDSSGNLLVGTTSNVDGNKVNIVAPSGKAPIGVQVGSNGNGAINWYNATGGYISSVIVNASSVAYNTTSDYRLKEDVAPMTGALDKVQQLKPVTYTWKSDGSAGQGFIAHELQAVVPDCVTGEKDAVDADGNPQYQGVDTSFLVATLVAALQEQQTLIQDLTARLVALEAK